MCSATSQKYVSHQHTTLSPQNMYVGGNGFTRNYNMSPSAKQSPISSIPIQMIVLVFSVLLCIFSCLLTVTLSYKWHMDTNQQINRLVGTVEDAIRDLNTFTDIVRDELVAKHVSNTYKDQHKAKIDGNDYEEVEEDYDGDRFMGRDLMDNNWPARPYQTNESNKPKNRERRNAVIDATTIVKNELNSSKNEKADVEIIQEENTVKTYRRRKSKKMGTIKKKLSMESEDEESYEDFKETQDNAAAHFTSDSSKYNTKTHPHYNGNGRLRHPDGDFRDWTQHLWDINLNNANHFMMKNGKVEVLKPGLYFVYAQLKQLKWCLTFNEQICGILLQIYYSDKHDINGYYVMKNDEKILGCTSTRHQDTQSSDSCYTGGLIYFNSKDNLSIKGLDSDRFIILDPVRSFFGLFRISKDGKK